MLFFSLENIILVYATIPSKVSTYNGEMLSANKPFFKNNFKKISVFSSFLRLLIEIIFVFEWKEFFNSSNISNKSFLFRVQKHWVSIIKLNLYFLKYYNHKIKLNYYIAQN